jgi:hypothetical protein
MKSVKEQLESNNQYITANKRLHEAIIDLSRSADKAVQFNMQWLYWNVWRVKLQVKTH